MARTRNASMKPRYGWGLVALAVVGVFGYDGVRTGLAAASAKDDATQIAHDSAQYYHSHPDVNAAYAAALAEAQSKGETIPVNDYSVSNGNTVSLRVTKHTGTLVLAKLHSAWSTMSGQASSTWTP